MNDFNLGESNYRYSFHEPLVQLKDIHLSFGDLKVLNGINATILNVKRPPPSTQGQVVSLLGPSGVGKSQCFWIIAGLGSVYHTGECLLDDPPRPAEGGMVGVVTQHYDLFEHRTVLGNLLVAAGLRGFSAKEGRQRAIDLLRRFGLEDKATSWVKALSGGQRQRVAICRSLLSSDRFLLMDEPFSGLDPVMKSEVCEIITEISSMDEKRTIIVITHDVHSAVKISDHIWLIGRDRDAEGKIIPGARIQEEIDLKQRGIAWRPEREELPQFASTVREIELRFRTL